MATTLVWWDVIEQVLAGIGGQPMMEGVQVVDAWPGDNAKGEHLYVGDVTSECEIPVSKAGRMMRDEMVTVPLLGRVIGRRTTALTFQRLQEIASAIEHYIADNVDLEDLDGVVSAEITSRVISVGTLPEGPVGRLETQLLIHTRLV